METAWTEKYVPKHIKYILQQPTGALVEWIENWTTESKPLLLVGAAGTGKTVSVYALANSTGYFVMEVNASDSRTFKKLEEKLGQCRSQSSLIGKRLILIDEADNLDRLGAKKLIDLFETLKQPIILTANNKKGVSKPVRSRCIEIRYTRVRATTIAKVLFAISQKEGIDAKNIALICENAKGDLRAAITALQYHRDDITMPDREIDIFGMLKQVLTATDIKETVEKLHHLDVSPPDVFPWIYDNIIPMIENPADRVNAIEHLSRADLFFRRAMRKRQFKLWRYAIDLMVSVRISLHGKLSWKRFGFPSSFIAYARAKPMKAIIQGLCFKLSKVYKCSSRKIKTEVLPYLSVIFQGEETAENPEMIQRIKENLTLTEEEITLIKNWK